MVLGLNKQNTVEPRVVSHVEGLRLLNYTLNFGQKHHSSPVTC